MNSSEVRAKFLEFFKERGHKIVQSSSLIPAGDPSVLFTTAGMQQFKSYYTNKEQAEIDFGTLNVTSAQKCVRTSDIDEVGDATHLSFFEMLGNFSFGGYGRKEAILYAHEFITKEMGLTISYVSVYQGNQNVPKDEASKKIWEEIGIKDIREEGADVFWGPTGDSGPCGPTTEIYCKNNEGKDVEIWNIVFNEYYSSGSREKLDRGEAELKKLENLGVDTGMGLERLLTIVNEKENVYETDLFNGEDTKERRIVADHIKAALFMITDGALPSNTGPGYILRRLIRRAVRFGSSQDIKRLLEENIERYEGAYSLNDNGEIKKEEERFRETLERGMKEFEKGIDPFVLATTYGFPIELTEELALERGKKIDRLEFEAKMKEHQDLSRTASAGMFKGGLANHEEETIKLHTAHHLLLAALQEIINKEVKQKGSNITESRLRIDFSCDHKLTDEEKIQIENWVNDKIEKKMKVIRKEMPLEEAKASGAEMEFGAKYGDIVSVYFIEDENGNPVSKEFCGGPHVENTSVLGKFKIKKEESVSKGVRRIKAVLL